MDFRYNDNIELLSNTIPENTDYLYFGDDFNQSVDMHPLSIKYLSFGHNFNKSVDMLPPYIIKLHFGHDFNQSVDMLPASITYLYFGYSFNQSVDMLASSIKFLFFGHNFNQNVDTLPSSIKFLYFHNKCLLKMLYVLNRTHNIYKNYIDSMGYNLKKEKCIKNENTPFSKHKIIFDMIYKNKKELFCNIKKIPYGCIYDSIVYI